MVSRCTLRGKKNVTKSKEAKRAAGGRGELIVSIIRMSQKALMAVLLMVGIGYLGGTMAILFAPELADPLARYTQVFIPLFQLEIGVYGLGSTLENVQKLRVQIDELNGKTQQNTSAAPESEDDDGNSNG